MKFLTKLIITIVGLTSVSVPIAMGGTYKLESNQNSETLNEETNEVYTLTQGDTTLKVNKDTLYFEVTKGNSTWNSGKVLETDEDITNSRRAFIESPLTVYFLTSNGGESSFSIFDSRHEDTTRVSFHEENDGFSADLRIRDGNNANLSLEINLTLNVKITDDGLNIYITDLEENLEATNRLSRLVIYPGFDASYGLVDGYALIPDGSGAIINYNEPTNARSALSLTTYDSDIGVRNNGRTSTTSNVLTLPMYAVNNLNSSYMVTIESGSEYSSLNSKVATMSDNYNLNYFSFTYREIFYRYFGISDSTRRPEPQENANQFLPNLTYHLYDDKLTYSEFAKEYQDYLLTNNLLNKASELESSLRLEFLMSESKPSMFGREVIAMTDTNFVKEVCEELKDEVNVDVSLLGASKGGYTNSYPNNFPLEKKTGSEGDYKDLISYLNSFGIETNFIVDYIRAFSDSSISDKDLAMNMSEKYIESNDIHPGSELIFNHLTLNKTKDKINGDLGLINELNTSGLDFTSIGNTLYSSYHNQVFSRTEAIKVYQDILSSLDLNVNLRKPNLYMYNYFNDYLETPISNSGFLIETSSIPFIPMVLSGYKNMYSSALNLNYLGTNQILNLIDYNVNPTYLLTKESAIELFQTSSEYIFSSMYSDWKEEIINSITLVNDILKEVSGANFINREEISNNVYKNTYSNNKEIIVNYSDNDFTYNGITIESSSAEVF